MPNAPSIAAVVLTKDEELNILNCLKSLGWVNELIVCDSGSSDRTVEIARDFGTNVFVHIPDGMFSFGEQRNWAIENCVKNADWILFIDADEIVTGKLEQEIIKKVQNPGDKIGFRLCPKFMFMGKWLKHVMRYPAWHDRLLLRGKVNFAGAKGLGILVDNFDCSPENVGCIYEPYLHYGFNKGLSDWVSKHNQYSSTVAKRLDEARKRGIDWKRLLKINDGDPSKPWKRALESLFSRFPAAYPVGQFFYVYMLKGGFLDGYPGLVYSLMLFQYNLVVWFKTIELKRRRVGLPL